MKSINKIVALLLLVVISLSPFTVFADNDNKPDLTPVIVVEDADIPKGVAGENVTINFKLKSLKNTSRNIVIKPELPENNNPFSFADNSYSQTIDRISANNSQNAKISLFVNRDAKEGIYPVKLNISYSASGDYTTPQTTTEIVYVKVVNLQSTPKLLITKVETDPEAFSPGTTGNMRIYLENKGSINAKDIEVSLGGLDSAQGFYLENGTNKEFLDRVNGNSDSFVDFNIAASRNIKGGGHELEVEFKYKSGGADIEDKQKIYLNVGKQGTSGANLNIEKLAFPTGAIRPGNDYVLSFDIANKGKLNATNIIVKAESSDPAVVPKSQSIRKIDTIAGGKSQRLDFIFTPTPDAETKNYPISITIEYEDELNQGLDNKYVLNQYVGIYANNPKKTEDDGKQSKPKLIINKYNFSPNLVKAGENFTMNLSFYNTNSSKAVKNIKIFLTSDEKTDPQSPSAGGNVFTPVDSSNTFFIDSIPPKGVVDKTITMFTVPDAQAKTYTITANFEYEDSQANEYTATELIGVPVVQKSKLDVGELNVPDELFAGDFNPISLEFYNTGKVTLYNLMVRLEGNFQKENANLYVGNFETGSSEMFDATIIPNEPGELKGRIIFSYEDSAGETIEHIEEFTSNVVEFTPPEGMDDFPMPEEPTGIKKILKNKWVWLGLIVLAVVGRKIYKKRKEQKEYDENHEDYDGDTDIIDKGSDLNE
ncbi:MAG TPA: hypothetical protein VIG40_08420 [Tissierellaceae bacterium]